MKLLFSAILTGLLVSGTSSFGQKEESNSTRSYIESSEKEQDLLYYQQTLALKQLLAKDKIPVNIKVVEKMLRAIDHNIPKFFPQGPFTRNDFIALAWLESAFNQYEVGTHGEKGLFQIMPDEFEDWHVTKNYYDVNVNTRMAFHVLNGKYQIWKDYKKAIQAYNGIVIVKSKTGRHWSEKYWLAFHKRKLAIDKVLSEKSK